MADEKKGARSYKSEVIGDSMSLTINFKWLIQLIVAVAMMELHNDIEKVKKWCAEIKSDLKVYIDLTMKGK